jgi:hypothetical protein
VLNDPQEAVGPEKFTQIQAIFDEAAQNLHDPPFNIRSQVAPFLEKDHPKLMAEFEQFSPPPPGSYKDKELKAFVDNFNSLETEEEKVNAMNEFMGFDQIQKVKT